MTTTTESQPEHPGILLCRELRKMGISQGKFAVMAGITRGVVENLAKGRQRIDLRTSFRIGAVLNIDGAHYSYLQWVYDLEQIKKDEHLMRLVEAIKKNNNDNKQNTGDQD